MAAPAAKPADLTGSLHACLSLQDGNNISGPLPVGGNSMESLQTVFVRPGNPLLCAASNAPPFRWAPGVDPPCCALPLSCSAFGTRLASWLASLCLDALLSAVGAVAVN